MKLKPKQIKAIAEEVVEQIIDQQEQQKKQFTEAFNNNKDVKQLQKLYSKLAAEYKKLRLMAEEIKKALSNDVASCYISNIGNIYKDAVEVYAELRNPVSTWDIEQQIVRSLTLQSIDSKDIDVAATIKQLVKQYT